VARGCGARPRHLTRLLSLRGVPAPLLAVDAPSLMYRAFFALPDSIKDAQGRPANALLGTTNLILWVVERHRPRAVVMCFGAEAATYRTDLFAPYHADRPEMPEGLATQWADAPRLFEEFGWTVLVHDTLEADDLLGTLAALETAAGGDTLLFTGDRDMFQCASDHVTVLFPRGGAQRDGPEQIGPDGVRERYGIEPEQVPDFIALRGDPSDGLPGAKGIGEKTARDLLRIHGDLEGVLAAAAKPGALTPRQTGSLLDAADELRGFREIATLQTVAGLERPPDRPTDFAQAAEGARRHGLQRLAERLEKMATA
jgi:5'-3' exonuclease